MDAYLVKHDDGALQSDHAGDEGEEEEEPFGHDAEDDGGDVTGDENDGNGLFDASSLGNLKDDVTEYLSIIQRMVPVAGLSVNFDLAAAAAAGEGGTTKPLLKLLIDAMAKIFTSNRSIESLTRRAEVTQANVERLQHVRVLQEQEHVRMDKEVARLERALSQQKVEFQRDTRQLRQELKETRLAHTQIKGQRGKFQARIRSLELEMGRLKDTLSRHLQQKDRKIKAVLAQTAKLQAACFAGHSARGRVATTGTSVKKESAGSKATKRKPGGAPRATGATKARAPAAGGGGGDDELSQLSVRALRAQNRRLAAVNQRFGSFFGRVTDVLGIDADPARFFAVDDDGSGTSGRPGSDTAAAAASHAAVTAVGGADFEGAILQQLAAAIASSNGNPAVPVAAGASDGDVGVGAVTATANAAVLGTPAAGALAAVSTATTVVATSRTTPPTTTAATAGLTKELEEARRDLAHAQAVIEEQNVLISSRLLADDAGGGGLAAEGTSMDDDDDSLLAYQKEQYRVDRDRLQLLRQQLEEEQRMVYDGLLRSARRTLVKRGRCGPTPSPSPFMAQRATRSRAGGRSGSGGTATAAMTAASASGQKENDDVNTAASRRGGERGVQVSPIACNLDESVQAADADVSLDFPPATPGTLHMLQQLEASEVATPASRV